MSGTFRAKISLKFVFMQIQKKKNWRRYQITEPRDLQELLQNAHLLVIGYSFQEYCEQFHKISEAGTNLDAPLLARTRNPTGSDRIGQNHGRLSLPPHDNTVALIDFRRDVREDLNIFVLTHNLRDLSCVIL